MKSFFHRLSLTRQFLLVSFPIILICTIAIGWWIGRQVERSVVHRIGSVTALYVDSFVAPHIQTLVTHNNLSAEDRAMLESDLNVTPLGKKIVALKIWRRDGYVLFSTDPKIIGTTVPVDEGLAIALQGKIFSEISERNDSQQSAHGQPMPRLIETYTPIHADRTGEVIAAAEFYERPDEVDREARTAQQRSWLVVAGSMLAMYVWLFLVVRRGSRTIVAQQEELSDKVKQLTQLNATNLQLRERVIGAAERATALNENFLKRVSADIHDGPGQDLGFALMQIKNIGESAVAQVSDQPGRWANGLEQARLAVESALKDLRAISADIELPDIGKLALAEIAGRVVRDFHDKTGVHVNLDVSRAAVDASFRVKVALYRLLQESLANTFRHARGAGCRVSLVYEASNLIVEVSDTGPGFDLTSVADKGRLGLQGMRQRVEVLGGTFEINTVANEGTVIRVLLPLLEKTDE